MLRDCLRYLSTRSDLKVTALVHNRQLCEYPGIDYIEIPDCAGNWFRRLRCEYITMWRISNQMPMVALWLSLHDTTPRVRASRQAVYCHNSFPFMKSCLRDWQMDFKIPLFSLFTRFIYHFRARKNAYMVVQQEWFRRGLSRMTGMPRERIIVAPPAFRPVEVPTLAQDAVPMFLYPATADCHKNFETLCEAARLLEKEFGTGRFKVCITVSGNENCYARYLKRRWGDVSSIDFHGIMSREELAQAYARAACLVFPSRTETWGLPVSEFLPTGKPMLLAELPYARETAAGALCTAFFPVRDARCLAGLMQDIVEGRMDGFAPVPMVDHSEPYAPDWASLFEILLA